MHFTPVVLLLQVVSNFSQDLAWYLDRVECLDSDFKIPPGVWMNEFRRLRRWKGRCREVELEGRFWLGFWGIFGHAVQILLLLCGWSTLTGLAL